MDQSARLFVFMSGATKEAVIEACLTLEASGLNRGASGNVSVRDGESYLITPSAIAYSEMVPAQITRLALDGDATPLEGAKPSSEWQIHRDLLRAHPRFNAVVHTHSPYATILANGRKPIPALHYMIAGFGGTDIPVADYATFGTAELSRAVITAMAQRAGCLMANHGAIVAAETLPRALWLAHELETLAHAYVHGLAINAVHILSDDEIADAAAKFAGYGQA